MQRKMVDLFGLSHMSHLAVRTVRGVQLLWVCPTILKTIEMVLIKRVWIYQVTGMGQTIVESG